MALTLGIIPLLRWIMLSAVLSAWDSALYYPTLQRSGKFSPSKLRSSVLAAGIGAGFLGQFLSPILLGPVLSYNGLEGILMRSSNCISCGRTFAVTIGRIT